MNWKLIFTLLFLPLLSYGQGIPHKCGIDAQTAALIKQRLMDNRAAFTKQQVKNLTTNRVITYIPLTIHNVANSNGEGRTDEATILAFLCGLNAIYASQDVQFFIHNQIRNVTNNYVDANAFTTTAQFQMAAMKIGNTLNLIIGRSTNNQSASYYNGAGDFVFLLQSMLASGAKTEAHEIGHFFTLPHTFYGWEGIDAEATYGGQNVPSTVGSGWSQFDPEAVPRTGTQSNCNTAADGFCDTEADYYSDRTACPYSPTVKDPYGNTLNPDEANLMSYAYDQCVTGFSPQQEGAIAMDIASRTWATNTPNSTTVINSAPTAVSPANMQPLGPISNSTVPLDWSDVTGATWYYLEVVGTTFPGLWLPNNNDVIYRGIIYNSNSSFNLPTTDLVAGQYYAWRVKALNGYSTCGPLGSYSKFEASTVTNIKDLPLEQQMTLKVNNNPVTTSYVPLSIYTAENVVGSIRVYATDGREVLSMTKEAINQGDNIIQLPAADLTNGVYVAVFSTDRGSLQQKFIIQR